MLPAAPFSTLLSPPSHFLLAWPSPVSPTAWGTHMMKNHDFDDNHGSHDDGDDDDDDDDDDDAGEKT